MELIHADIIPTKGEKTVRTDLDEFHRCKIKSVILQALVTRFNIQTRSIEGINFLVGTILSVRVREEAEFIRVGKLKCGLYTGNTGLVLKIV